MDNIESDTQDIVCFPDDTDRSGPIAGVTNTESALISDPNSSSIKRNSVTAETKKKVEISTSQLEL